MVLFLGGMLLSSNKVLGAAKLTLTAVKVKKAPAGLDDPVWEKAQAVQLPLEGKGKLAEKKLTVITKAVYTYEDIYFLFAWKDATKSLTKKAWQFDGHKWSHLEGNEDRLALLFEITRIKNFGSQGCTAACHGPYHAVPCTSTSSPPARRPNAGICGTGKRPAPIHTTMRTTVG